MIDMRPKTYRIGMVAACPLPYDRGTPVRIFRMAEALALSGCEVHVFAYHLGNIGIEEERRLPFYIHRIGNVPTYRKYSSGPTLQKLMVVDALLLAKLVSVAKYVRFDVIHAHHYEGLILSLLFRRLLRIPIVYDAHTLLESELHYYFHERAERLVRHFGQLIDNKLPIRADHIITVTSDIRRKLIANAAINPERISVIMNGVESNHFDRPFSTKHHHEPSETIIYAGNLGRFQGIEHLLHIFSRIVQLRPSVKLKIITGECFDPYLSLARKLGVEPHIQVVPSSYHDLPDQLSFADVALNPRVECDGIPQKLLNYMAAGRPVVSFEGSAKVIDHRQNGYVVENGNYAEFAKGVLFLLDNPDLAESLGARAKKKVLAEFSWQRRVDEIMAVYRQLYEQKESRLSKQIS